METRIGLKPEHRQSQALAPHLRQAVRLLQLSALDYEQELHQMIGRNPFLELDESPTPWPDAGRGDRISTSDLDASDTACEKPDSLAEAESGWGEDSWLIAGGPLRDGPRETGPSAADLMAAPTDLRQQLHGQARLLRLSARDRAVVFSVIESLDDDGYLRLSLADMGALAELHPPADLCEAQTALRLVQSFEPAGVGARDLAECLALQLEKVAPAWRELGRTILTQHLALLARHDAPALANRLECSRADAEATCRALRRLDPRPGAQFARDDSPQVTPEVVVRKLRGKWVAQLNLAARPRLRLNRDCVELFERHRAARHAELGAHLLEARWTLRNIEQRFSTILEVSQALLRRQHLFFEHGPLAMKPLALRDIAQEIGLHESTVCRVTNNKYMATPGGVFELKHFFSRAMPLASGGASTGTAIRRLVQEMIEAEDPSRPLSDVAITQRLTREGMAVARRTVTKYRQGLRIAPAERRRPSVSNLQRSPTPEFAASP